MIPGAPPPPTGRRTLTWPCPVCESQGSIVLHAPGCRVVESPCPTCERREVVPVAWAVRYRAYVASQRLTDDAMPDRVATVGFWLGDVLWPGRAWPSTR